MNQHDDDERLNDWERKVWMFYQQGRDAHWIAQQFHLPVATITRMLLEIQRKLQEREA